MRRYMDALDDVEEVELSGDGHLGDGVDVDEENI